MGWSSSLVVGRGAKTRHPKRLRFTKHFTRRRTWNDLLVQDQQWKEDLKVGWTVELYNIQLSPNIIRMIKSRRKRRVGPGGCLE